MAVTEPGAYDGDIAHEGDAVMPACYRSLVLASRQRPQACREPRVAREVCAGAMGRRQPGAA